MGNSSPSSSISFFLKIYDRKAPSMLPVNIVKKRSILSISFKFPPSSRYPGKVNATPPATIEPALIIVWVTVISFMLFLLKSLSKDIEINVTIMVGQGNAPNFSTI